MKNLLLLFIALFSSFQIQAGACEFTHTLTELLLDEEDSQIIILGKVESMYFLKNGRIINEISVTKVFRGENVSERIKVTSGIWNEFQAKKLTVGDDYLIIGKPWDGKSDFYSAFTCDRMSGNILKNEKGEAKDLRATQNLGIIEDYFLKKATKFTGLVNIYRDTFLLLTGNMVKGKQEGIWKNYLINHDDVYRQVCKLSYKNGKLHGESQYFIREESLKPLRPGKVVSSKKGKINKIDYFSRNREVDYYFSSSLKYKYRTVKTVRKEKVYFPDAQLKIKRKVINYNFSRSKPYSRYSFLSGKYIEYFENGEEKEIGKYLRGKKVGLWNDFDEKTKTQSQKKYNKPHFLKGYFTAFYETGDLKSKGKLVNNKREGAWSYYYETGAFPFKIVYFQNDRLHDKIKYFNTKTGKLTKIEKYSNNVLYGSTTTFDENQNITALENYQNGEKHGNQLRYFSSGKLKSESKYESGKPVGVIKEYHKSGIVSRISTLHDAYSDWSFEEYDKEGKLTKKGQYIEGRRPVGVWTGYFANRSKKVCFLDNSQPAEIDPIDNFTFSPCRYFDKNNKEISEKEYLNQK